MLFNSWLFLLFALVVFPLYYSLRFRAQNIMLLIASYLFYGAWDWRFLGLIVASTFIDYFIGLKIEDSNNHKKRHQLLLISCIFNLSMLAFFKYYGFFVESAEELIVAFGVTDVKFLRLNIILPVGISFYTFQTMSYTIDIYRREVKPIKNYIDYSLYVAYFPQLVAGPIERATNLVPQVIRPRTITRDNILSGLWLILWGLFKKMIIADNLSVVVDDAFAAKHNVPPIQWIIALYAFAYQIYCDFSGYSDIARGLSKLMGFELMRNFNIPYLSKNPSEFWRRWHISLSSWLRDYLYIPLGGNRGSNSKTYRNLLMTMILGGLWHGAAWTFIWWGVFHGGMLSIHRFLFSNSEKVEDSLVQTCFKRFFFFHLTCFGWLLFRAENMGQIGMFFASFLANWGLNPSSVTALTKLCLFVGLLWFFELLVKNADDPRLSTGWNRGVGPLTFAILILCLIILTPPSGVSFIYFQF